VVGEGELQSVVVSSLIMQKLLAFSSRVFADQFDHMQAWFNYP